MVRTTHAAYLIILYDSTARVRASHARPAPNPLAASHPRDRCASTAAPPTTHDARRADCVHAPSSLDTVLPSSHDAPDAAFACIFRLLRVGVSVLGYVHVTGVLVLVRACAF
ncbi:hypothetical protein B0H17DRAFT_1200553 [Mycena rosella]|uniref:Uncharacterized protein n=1 Tax=Mycena rosella TaxID=1033263 RepID=A0AAD7GJN0_MYCRO|nr:hypothetical protein B0H17DRAFT_1200553 [Mycena rosella]